MANEKKYTPEVERLLLAARGLYEAAGRAKLTPGLAVALRDGIDFEKLQNPEILSLCQFVRELDKVGTLAKPDAPEAATPAANGETTEATQSKPDDKKGKASKGAKNIDSTP